MDFEENKSKKNKIVSLVLCLSLFVVTITALFSPVITVEGYGLSPFRLAFSSSMNDMGLNLNASYYVSKYFYLVFGIVFVGTTFLVLYYFITKNKKLQKYTDYAMFVTIIFLFISMLIGFNFVNIYETLGLNSDVKTFAYLFFIFGFILLLAKYMSGVFNNRETKDELKESSVSIIMSFVLTVLTIGTLFTPMYIFPGTPYRMNGLDILSGKEDVLSFLPMAGFYKALIIIFIVIVSISFIMSIIFFLKSRKIFIHYNKYHNLLGFLSILSYALMGLNYYIVYFDTGAFNTFPSNSMNTYSYIPLVLFALFWIGSAFTKMSMSNLNVEYRIYAKPKGNENKNVAKSIEKASSEDNGVLDPIPAFSELDKQASRYDMDYADRKSRMFMDLTLPKLVNHVIEYAKYSREKLSYGKVEIKTFLAGLAASRLAILQGMSGTGKTSLPKIFMESIDGICDLVAVESSWRDKNELLGYYNEFNKKYTPKSFTQFLYKASLNKETPCFIVLDEMNLSRIEYYFSDFLSLMEGREENRYIKLFDVQLFPSIDERTDYYALRDGHTIDVPPNVWFIGTANRDESTFEISDKVYDRAQTMNFDKRAPKIYSSEQVDYAKKFVSYPELRGLFNGALNSIKFDAESYDATKKVEALLRPYNISFGNRILKQIDEFVKVYVASSEISTGADRDRFIHEAFDCIIFSKVVRKLEFKQVSDIESLVDEFAALKLTKCEEFLRTLVEVI